MAILNREQIMEIIPHRDPFLLIDEVLELEPGKRCVAQKFMDPDSYWFRGHFPGYPVTPGVLMLEMLAQAGAVCALSLEENKGKLAVFGGMEKVRFRRQVRPGELLRLEIEVIRSKGPVGVGKGVATVGGERAVNGELTFALIDPGKQ